MRRVICVGIVCLLSVGCDISSAVQKLFTDQGLHLVKPVRSYIEIGGLVVSPKGGRTYYYDRNDPLPAGTEADPVIRDFEAVLAKETANQSVGFGAAVGALQSLISIPLGVKYDQNQMVEMSQIKASGKRLPIPAAQSYIQAANTKATLEGELKAGGKAYLIYEVYYASALTIKGTGNKELAVDLAIGASTGSSTTAAAADAAATTKPSTPTAAQTPPQSDKTAKPPVAADTTKAPADATAKDVKATEAKASGLNAKWTRKSATELVLEGDTAYPFAIRVAEVELGPLGLRLKPGSFKFKGTLAAGTDEERFTAVLNKGHELDLVRRSK